MLIIIICSYECESNQKYTPNWDSLDKKNRIIQFLNRCYYQKQICRFVDLSASQFPELGSFFQIKTFHFRKAVSSAFIKFCIACKICIYLNKHCHKLHNLELTLNILHKELKEDKDGRGIKYCIGVELNQLLAKNKDFQTKINFN